MMHGSLTTDGAGCSFQGLIPSILFLILLLFIPETPRYLMMKNRKEEALDTIIKISGKENALRIQSEIEESLMEKNAPWLSLVSLSFS